MKPISDVFLEDCYKVPGQGMHRFPDKYFELALVDPPFGIGMHGQIGKKKGERGNKWIGGDWDNEVPSQEYFKQLFRISKNQIILGGNYFDLPPTRCFLIWDKVQRIDMADCEYAWTSFDTSARIFTFARSNIQGFRNPLRFHPTEKPISLYRWLLQNYAKPGDKILDTHLGSQSSRIAAYHLGYDFTGFEIDPQYFEEGNKRFQKAIAEPLFDVRQEPEQKQLFDFDLNKSA